LRDISSCVTMIETHSLAEIMK